MFQLKHSANCDWRASNQQASKRMVWIRMARRLPEVVGHSVKIVDRSSPVFRSLRQDPVDGIQLLQWKAQPCFERGRHMEMQAITFRNRWYGTVFVVQNQEVTIMDKQTAGTQGELREWCTKNSYPTAGELLTAKPDAHLSPGYYIDPHLKEFYYSVDPASNHLIAASPEDFFPHQPFHV